MTSVSIAHLWSLIARSQGWREDLLVKKFDVGFSNEVYSIGRLFVLKVYSSEAVQRARIETQVLECLAEMSWAPRMLWSDLGGELCGRPCVVMERRMGENLYGVWPDLTEFERHAVVGALCRALERIGSLDPSIFPCVYGVRQGGWAERVLRALRASVSEAQRAGAVDAALGAKVLACGDASHEALIPAVERVVYWDVHFDNVLVHDGCFHTLLDYERVGVGSIDVVLDVVRRMVEHPTKYMHTQWIARARHEDYTPLLGWFQEYAPELFAFPDLARRLDVYTLIHDLQTLSYWPEATVLRERIEARVECMESGD